MGTLSRLVGKPPFSPWLSKNVLPLKKAANGPNSAILLTQTFDRILFCVYNSLYFGVQKAKNGDRGTIVFTATLKYREKRGHTVGRNISVCRGRDSNCQSTILSRKGQ